MATTALLETAYVYRDEDAVRAYLSAHPDVEPVLIAASRLIPRYFGASPSLVLDVLTDPEHPQTESLFALIQTSLEPDEALPLLDAFNDRWWRAESATVDADLQFGLDHV